jgi:hypothetical protein
MSVGSLILLENLGMVGSLKKSFSLWLEKCAIMKKKN